MTPAQPRGRWAAQVMGPEGAHQRERRPTNHANVHATSRQQQLQIRALGSRATAYFWGRASVVGG